TADQLLTAAPAELFTNDRGQFSTAALAPGFYSVKVTLAGFLPSIDQHIGVSDQHTTLLQIVMGSVFTSLEKMRHDPSEQVASDEWTWVLRSSPATRPVLRWQDDDAVLDAALNPSETDTSNPWLGRLDLTSGSDHPGSVSNLADAPATAFAYDWKLGARAKMLLAGQFSYDGATPAGGIAAEWIPSGDLGSGSVSSVLIRESRVGPDGPVFRGMRLSHDDQLALGSRVSIRYGAEFLVAGLDGNTASLRPRAEVAVQVAQGWLASLAVASRPWQDTPASGRDLQSAMNSLDAMPTLLLRNGRPVLEDNLHEEIAVEHLLSKTSDITIAGFHDRSANTAIYGLGEVSGGDYLPDSYSRVFAYDAGTLNSLGVRAAYHRKLSNNSDLTLVYAYAGALAPDASAGTGALRNELSNQYRNSIAARVSDTLPRLHTRVITSYKWIGGNVVSRQDVYGESVYHLDPYLSLQLRQPLPSFIPGHVEAIIDIGNLLAQGYVPLATGDGNVILVPSYRYLRGGLSFQF
ncbi:MAG: carboxypeptidase-like regulatory domain-containing protein, partial [Candidatus Acidiferrales bacterium]